MNITLVFVVVVIIAMGVRGFKKGFVKEISEILSLAVALLTVLLLIMLYLTFQNKEVGNLLITIGILLVLSACYFFSRLLLRIFKMICRLPFIKYLNKILGIISGGAEGVLLIWIFYLLNEQRLFGSYSDIVKVHTTASELLTLIYEYNYLIKIAGI